MKKQLTTRTVIGIALMCVICLLFIGSWLPWALFMFAHVPYEGAKGIALALGAGDKLAEYLAYIQVGANLLAIAIGVFLMIRQKPLKMPRGSKGLLIYIVIALPTLLYAVQIWATRGDNPWMKFDSLWYLLVLITPMNPIFPPFVLMAALETIAREFYGQPTASEASEEA